MPTLEAYGFSSETGFLPSPSPLARLPALFSEWETILTNLHPLMLKNKLRDEIRKLNNIDTSSLHSLPLKRRAFVVLTFLANSYLIGIANHDPLEIILPRQIAVPWFNIAKELGVKPCASYAAVDLWNCFDCLM
jgi:indoleamine 2,3-dioxygenase